MKEKPKELAKFRVLVHHIGKDDYEKVADFDTTNEAYARIDEFRDNRDKKVRAGENHYLNLDWVVTRVYEDEM